MSVWSYTFVQGKSGKHEKEVGQTRNFGLGRVWVGKVDSGDWVGVWEFKGDVGMRFTSAKMPLLAQLIS